MQALYQLLRKLTLPGNAGTGARIVLDGTTDAILIYDAANRLVDSIAATAGFDQFGNNFLQGFTSYDRNNNEYINVTGDNILMGAIVAGQPTLVGAGFIQNAGDITIQSQTFGSFNTAIIAEFNSGVGGSGTGSGLNPALILLDSALANPVDIALSGNVIKTANGGTFETNHTPTYNTNFSGSTTFNGSTGWSHVTFRKNATDSVTIAGAFTATAAWVVGNGVTPFVMPAGFAPAFQWPIHVERNNAAVQTNFAAQLTTAGSFNLISNTGGGVAANNEFLIPAQTYPLGNLP